MIFEFIRAIQMLIKIIS